MPSPRVLASPVREKLPLSTRISSPASRLAAFTAPLLVRRMSLPSAGAATIAKAGALNAKLRSSRAAPVAVMLPSVIPFVALISTSSPAVAALTLAVPLAIRRISSPAASVVPLIFCAFTPSMVAALAEPSVTSPVETAKILSAVEVTSEALPVLLATISAAAVVVVALIVPTALSATLRPALVAPAMILLAAV